MSGYGMEEVIKIQNTQIVSLFKNTEYIDMGKTQSFIVIHFGSGKMG